MPTTNGALGTGNVNIARSQVFNPQIWSDEVINVGERKLVAAKIFRKISMVGKKGSVLRLPAAIRASANVKAANAQVQVQFATETDIQLTVNRHFESSRAIEDIVGIQALSSLRRFYTDDMGYALARQKDIDILSLMSFLNQGAGAATFATGFIGADGNTAYTSGAPNSASITDLAIRRTIQRLDENDLPDDGRVGIFSAGSKFNLMGIDRFVAYNFLGERSAGNTIRNGMVGNLYGMDLYFSNALPVATGGAKANFIGHEDAFVYAQQKDVRVQTQYKLEFLADLIVADQLYGVACRLPGNVDIPTGGYSIMTPN
jgi:hypothetical protein